jgi:phospholipid-binding lipoprotein MlaA
MSELTRSSPAGRSVLPVQRRAAPGARLAGYLGVVFAACLAAGCATAPAKKAKVDPWEPVNRGGYAIEGKLDHFVIHPLSKAYRFLTPGPIGRGIHNVLVNLSEPSALINDVFQLRIKRAGTPAARLVINSTVGVLGLFDVASHMGLYHHDNEFGVTLGRYGVKPGPYVYLPLVGPSTVRDLVGTGVDVLLNPLHWATYADQAVILDSDFALNGLDKQTSTEAELHALLSTAVDPYATLRSAYLQNKQGEIDGEGMPLELPAFEEPGPAPAPAPAEPVASARATPTVSKSSAPLETGQPSLPAPTP